MILKEMKCMIKGVWKSLVIFPSNMLFSGYQATLKERNKRIFRLKAYVRFFVILQKESNFADYIHEKPVTRFRS